MPKSRLKSIIVLQVLVALLFAICSEAYSGEIVVQPGKFDHFNIKLSQAVTAGDNVKVEITAVDSFNNVIPKFSDSGREFSATASGSAKITPTTIKSSGFSDGVATLTLHDTAAETVTISIYENGNPIPLQTRDVTVVAGKLNSFVVRGPRTATAGQKFDVRITAADAYGNTVTEPLSGKNINLLFKGVADPRLMADQIPDFKNGFTTVSLMSEKSGGFMVEAKDLSSGSYGSSAMIEIVNGPLVGFTLLTPKEIVAGEPFDVSIAAVDAYNNIAKNYASAGNGITVSTTGKTKPFPSTVAASEFVNGQAKVSFRYDTTEGAHDIKFAVHEINKTNTGTSEVIKVVPSIPTRYEVTNPQSAIAGQKFKIKVTVYNQLGNPMKNYNLIGPDVLLSSTATGRLTPSRIPASEFINGSAVVDVQYNKSEAFAIIAEPYQHEKAKAVTTEAGAGKAGALEITNISLVESQNRATVSIHIPALKDESKLKYKVSPLSAKSKRWIIMRISGVVSKVSEPVKFNSASVGRVIIEKDKKAKDVLVIKIENLKSASFKTQKSARSLNVIMGH